MHPAAATLVPVATAETPAIGPSQLEASAQPVRTPTALVPEEPSEEPVVAGLAALAERPVFAVVPLDSNCSAHQASAASADPQYQELMQWELQA